MLKCYYRSSKRNHKHSFIQRNLSMERLFLPGVHPIPLLPKLFRHPPSQHYQSFLSIFHQRVMLRRRPSHHEMARLEGENGSILLSHPLPPKPKGMVGVRIGMSWSCLILSSGCLCCRRIAWLVFSADDSFIRLPPCNFLLLDQTLSYKVCSKNNLLLWTILLDHLTL